MAGVDGLLGGNERATLAGSVTTFSADPAAVAKKVTIPRTIAGRVIREKWLTNNEKCMGGIVL